MQEGAKPDKNYFNQGTEDAIVAFQSEPDLAKRQQIFVVSIKPAFDKLVENIINVYHFHIIGGVDVLKNDCVSMLFECLSKFNASKGHKAFSYFNVIAKNWFIQKNKAHKKKNSADVHFDRSLLSYLEKNSENMLVQPHEEQITEREFYEALKDDMRTWGQKLGKPQEGVVLDAICVLIDNPDLLSIYNKKGIYLYIREMTNLNTKQIVANLSRFRKRYAMFKRKYQAGRV